MRRGGSTPPRANPARGGDPGGWRPLRLIGVVVIAFAALATVRVLFWGRPVPRSAVTASITPQDIDGDGTWDRFATGAGAAFERPRSDTPGARMLIVCLDGVPPVAMRDLWRRGHFREFFPPIEVISTFPSESEVALTAILHAAPAHGYENLYFDRAKGEISGGISVTLAQAAPYLRKFHYDEAAIFKGIHYVLPVRTFRADLGRLRKRFLESSHPVFIAHISSTDGLYHIYGDGRTRSLLVEAEQMFRDIYLEARGRVRMMLFSDHGNNLATSRAAPLRESLVRAGFELTTRLEGARGVVIPQFGLVSFAAVYTQPPIVREVANALAATEGVEIVAFAEGSGVRVLSRDGEALVDATADRARYRYRAQHGDPLGMAALWNELRRAGKLDSDGFAADADLFQATVHAPFPDALFRIMDSRYVENRADILVSLADGYYSGSGMFQRIVTLASTHGALSRGSTVGFAMSTDAPFPRPLRYNELLTPR